MASNADQEKTRTDDHENYLTILARDNWYKVDDYKKAYTDIASAGLDKQLDQLHTILDLSSEGILEDDNKAETQTAINVLKEFLCTALSKCLTLMAAAKSLAEAVRANVDSTERAAQILHHHGLVPEAQAQATFAAVSRKVNKISDQIKEDNIADFLDRLKRLDEIRQKLETVDTAGLDFLKGKIDDVNLRISMGEGTSAAVHSLGDHADTIIRMVNDYSTFRPEITNNVRALERVQLELSALDKVKIVERKLEQVQKDLEDCKRKIRSNGTAAGGPSGLSGTRKAPELTSMEPSEFKAFKVNIKSHATVHDWDEDTKKAQLMLSVAPKIHGPLRLAVPNWEATTFDEILNLWEKRIIPETMIQLAVMHLSSLSQKLEESYEDYLCRAQDLFVRAHINSTTPRDPEKDPHFVLQVLNGIRDKTLLDHLRRRQPQTLTELREAINAEVTITALSPTFQPGTATIAKIDGRDSNEKATPPCSFCQDKKHSTSQCRKLTAHWEQRAKLAKQQLQEAKKQGGGGGGGNRGFRGGRGGRNNYRGNQNNQNGKGRQANFEQSQKRPYEGDEVETPKKFIKQENPKN